MSSGKIVQIIGAVVDVEFPRESLPKVYDALNVDSAELTLEVQQQIGDGVVRAIAMGTTDGLSRGLDVSNSGEAIKVPRPFDWPGPDSRHHPELHQSDCAPG